ncbi:hypothetical protein HPP92_008417 [Vanilla planifolia]|uniref:Retrovirus-related Pol polyprotein from transposon TNT 1-94-like beta-barrel domain-containing protein n=1 Tax=Vanilla planifolia TaxID=51239 RepID=A0A835V5N2_VANPL|nr:hypothetical protein HPP92_008417 [Vanilla planifolia]
MARTETRFGHRQTECYQKQRAESKKNVECHYCHKYGHVQADCYKKQRDEEQASFVEEKNDQHKVFMARTENNFDVSKIWFLDSGCSNHMTGFKHLFSQLDETHKLKVKLGDDKVIQVEGLRFICMLRGALKKTEGGRQLARGACAEVGGIAHRLSGVDVDEGTNERKECIYKDKVTKVGMLVQLFDHKVV